MVTASYEIALFMAKNKKRCITEMSTDINEQVFKELESSIYGFAIQLDETTDVSNCAQFLDLSVMLIRIQFEANYRWAMNWELQQEEKICLSLLITFSKKMIFDGAS